MVPEMLIMFFAYLAVSCLPTWAQGPLDGYMKGAQHLDMGSRTGSLVGRPIIPNVDTPAFISALEK